MQNPTVLPVLTSLATMGSTTSKPEHEVGTWPFLHRFFLLNVALFCYGVGLAAVFAANVGFAPWEALYRGIAQHIPWLSIGMASIAIGCVLQAIAWFVLKVPPGVGSLLSVFLIGFYIDVFYPLLPVPGTSAQAWLMFAVGVTVSGLAAGTYYIMNCGVGPLDSVTHGIAEQTGWPLRLVRTGLEVFAILIGWLLGATIGWGTILFAVTFGPIMSLGLQLCGIRR
jgi:uncharacterized protein